eukprot:TRINITY_DN1627_c0_g1_i2.p1 TRINITY_DN1627_c0_g1~~TRINITY_DN1627_c0_g1_i2.p1  ORF type:complete len:272 (+),score=52.45 TRINITY_DN1627_c0_g1_i2:79-894(+)
MAEKKVPNPKKRARTDDVDKDDSDDEKMEIDGEEIVVDFVFSDPKEIDYKTIKTFVMNYLDGQSWNYSEFTDLLLSQPYIGSLIKIEGDEEGYGFISIINLHEHKDKQCIQQIKAFIRSKVAKGTPEQIKLWGNILEEPRVGLIVNERMLNVPPQLAPHLHKCLYEEVDWALEDGKPFKFDNLIMLTCFYEELAGNPKQKKQKLEEIFFHKVEDSIYKKYATDTLAYRQVINDQDAKWMMDRMARPYRLLILLDATKAKIVVDETSALVNE